MAGRVENLRPWKPGQSGNPGGRPKKKPITELYEQLLNDDATLKAIKRAILRSVKCSRTTLVPLLREMADRVEGKISQSVDAKVTTIPELTDEELHAKIQRLTKELRLGEYAGTGN